MQSSLTETPGLDTRYNICNNVICCTSRSARSKLHV